jgi:hypothetical protein
MGLKELVLIAMVVVALYGRSGVVKSRQVQTVLPWLSPRRRTSAGASRQGRSARPDSPASPPRTRPFVLRGNRLYWFLTILAATAVAALIISRALIMSGASAGLTH